MKKTACSCLVLLLFILLPMTSHSEAPLAYTGWGEYGYKGPDGTLFRMDKADGVLHFRAFTFNGTEKWTWSTPGVSPKSLGGTPDGGLFVWIDGIFYVIDSSGKLLSQTETAPKIPD